MLLYGYSCFYAQKYPQKHLETFVSDAGLASVPCGSQSVNHKAKFFRETHIKSLRDLRVLCVENLVEICTQFRVDNLDEIVYNTHIN